MNFQTSNKTEVLAGLTTFLTMSYIIVVNPTILSTEGTGMSFSGVLTATVMVSFISTLLMGLVAKLPFALAPGMGLNAFFTFGLILGQKIPYEQALGMVFWSGLFFIIISATPLREMIAKSIPHHLRIALACGIGLFLTFIGLKNALMLEAHPATIITYSKLSIEQGLAFIGLIVAIFFFKKKNPAAFLISIAITSLCALIFGKISMPENFFAMPDFSSVFMKMDLIGSLKFAYIPSIITLMMTDLFDSLSTFIGVSQSANLLDEKGDPKNMKKALIVDAIGTMISGMFGTSAATTYIESSAGTEVGGRRGLTAMVCAICFLPFLFLSPLISIVPAYATAPILIFIGALMFREVRTLKFDHIEDVVPAYLMMILIPLSFSITHGILLGFFAHSVMYLISGKWRELHPLMIIFSLLGIFLL
jgi:adenine/guanine/hypoxanthine permease